MHVLCALVVSHICGQHIYPTSTSRLVHPDLPVLSASLPHKIRKGKAWNQARYIHVWGLHVSGVGEPPSPHLLNMLEEHPVFVPTISYYISRSPVMVSGLGQFLISSRF